MGGTQGMVFRWIRELNHLPRLKQDKGRAGAWARVGGCDRVHLGLAGTKIFPRLRGSPGEGCIQPPSPQALQAPLVLRWSYWLEPLFHLRAAPQPPTPAPGVTGTTTPGQTCELWMGFVFLHASARSALCSYLPHSPAKLDRQTDHLQPEPTPQPLSWVGNKSPPAPARQIHVCLAKPFCSSC